MTTLTWSEMIGRKLGRYEIVSELGRGGSARVFRARDTAGGRDVAIKIIPNDVEDRQVFVRRFQLEIEVVRKLHHPSIVAVYGAGETDDVVYLVMQCVEGGTLRRRIDPVLPVHEAAAYGMQMARALHHAHARGIVHRDVKPSNMLVDADDPRRLLLADFGIAKIQGLRGITKTGMTIGTPEYMSPEQAQGGESDARSDIYSLGCVMYEMLTGRPPFTDMPPISILYHHVHERPAYIRGFNPAVPQGFSRLISVALAKKPGDRYRTADEFADALAPWADPGYRGEDVSRMRTGPPAPQRTTPQRTTPKWRRTGAPAVVPPATPVELDRLFPPLERPLPAGPMGSRSLADAAREMSTIDQAATVPRMPNLSGPTAGAPEGAEAPGGMDDVAERETVEGPPIQAGQAAPTSQPLGERSPTSAGRRTGLPLPSRAPGTSGASLGDFTPPTPLSADEARAAIATGQADAAGRPRAITRPTSKPLSTPSAPLARPAAAATARKRRRRPLLAVVALIAVAALGALGYFGLSATGVGLLQGPRATATSTATTAPTATATTTASPTATSAATSVPQQVLDQQASNSFRAATLTYTQDLACSAGNAETSFTSGQMIVVNLCTSGNVASGPIAVSIRQVSGGSVPCVSSISPNNSYTCHLTYTLAAGSYTVAVTMRIGGATATARTLPFTVTA